MSTNQKGGGVLAGVMIICIILSMGSCTANQVIEARKNYLELEKIKKEIADEHPTH